MDDCFDYTCVPLLVKKVIVVSITGKWGKVLGAR